MGKVKNYHDITYKGFTYAGSWNGMHTYHKKETPPRHWSVRVTDEDLKNGNFERKIDEWG
ncbi:hypothetical protein KAR91_83860 [Candidatus Pacearchaeota archaeon]|nr:hypothetical protein [Candidatus Pacearchaeota archaeon]